MEFVELSESEFFDIQNNMPGNCFYQTVEWAKVKCLTGWKAFYVAVREEDKIIFATMLLAKEIFFNKKMFYAPRGFLMDYSNSDLLNFATEKIKKFIKSKGGILLKIDPCVEYKHHNSLGDVLLDDFSNDDLVFELRKLGYRHRGFTTGYSDEAQFRWSYFLDINKSKEEIFKGMDQRCRRCIRKYEKYPLFTKDVDENNIDDFKGIMESTAIRQKHFDRSRDYYLNLKNNLGNRIKLIVIYLDKNKYLDEFKDDKLYDIVKMDDRKYIPISAGVFIFDCNKTNYVYGGTESKYMGFMAQYKLQMDMIYLSMDKGIDIFDFGGISGNFESGTPNYGVYEFKRGFGGYVVEYIGEFDLIINYPLSILYKVLYWLYRWVKKIFGFFKHK